MANKKISELGAVAQVSGAMEFPVAVSGGTRKVTALSVRAFALDQGVVNVRDYGAAGDGTTDDTAAINLAIAQVNSLARTQTKAVLYFPGGTYLLNTSTALTQFSRAGVVVGDGTHRSFIRLGTTYAGDVFSWTEAWSDPTGSQNVFDPTANTINGSSTADDTIGAGISGISIIGDRSASGTQNGLVFYDRNDHGVIEDVHLYYLNGRAFSVGQLQDKTEAYMREFHIRNLKAWMCGNETGLVPSIEFNTQGSGDATNSIHVYGLNVFASWGPSLVIRNQDNSSKSTSNLYFYGCRLEGIENASRTTQAGNLLQLGHADDTATLGPNNIQFHGLMLLSAYGSYAAIKTEAPNTSYGNNMYSIVLRGTIDGTNTGDGIDHTAGRAITFDFPQIAATGTDVIVSALASAGRLGATRFDNWLPSWTLTTAGNASNLITFPPLINNGIPSTGTYGEAQVVWNKNVSKTLPAGWFRVDSGDSHTLFTNWYPLPVTVSAITDNAILRSNGTNGNLQNSTYDIDDNGNVSLTGTHTMIDGAGGLNFRSYTAASAADINSGVNKQFKAAGKGIWDSTNSRPLWATASTTAATWVDAQGSAAVTPS